MPLLIGEHYRTARQSLDRARMRTFLTISGVAIGVASITAIMALSGGVTKVIDRQVFELGDSLAVVRPIVAEPTLSDLSNPTPQNAYSTSPLQERDIQSIRDLPATESVAPLMTISGTLRTKGTVLQNRPIVATTPELEDLTQLKISNGGQFIDTVTNQNTAVIGAQLSVDLFGTEQSNGSTFSIRGQTFTILGVLQRQNNPINYNNIDFDQAAIISLESGKLFNGGVAQLQQINIRAQAGSDMPKFEKDVSALLEKNHNNQQDVAVFIGKEIASPTSNLFTFVSAVMTAIAGISLVVGGVGIMNIMLVGVSERTREIGLRKAVGASNGTIVAQFMIEALILSFLGGLLGFFGGYFVAFLISMFIPYDPAFTWYIVGYAAALSLGVGVLFGTYPALRAARKDPIESLRRSH